MSHLQQLREHGFTDLTPDDLVKVAIHDFKARYIDELAGVGIREASLDEYVQMWAMGIDAQYVQRVRANVSGELGVRDLIALRRSELNEWGGRRWQWSSDEDDED